MQIRARWCGRITTEITEDTEEQRGGEKSGQNSHSPLSECSVSSVISVFLPCGGRNQIRGGIALDPAWFHFSPSPKDRHAGHDR